MNLTNKLLLGACTAGLMAACADKAPQSAVIETEIPERPAGQEDMVGFAAEPIDTVRVGFIGLGMRGPDAVERFTYIPGTKVVALCDIDSSRVEDTQKILDKRGMPRAAAYYGSEDAWKNSWKGMISISSISSLIGKIMLPWDYTQWRMANTWLSRCPPQLLSMRSGLS